MSDSPRVRNIYDLARLAGVSAGTVSRALSGSTLIAPATRERIAALAAAHDFKPNQMARNLRIQKTGAIGVVIPLGHETQQHLSDPFFMQMLAHLADELTERGQNLLLSRAIPSAPDWLDRIIDSGHVDGVIVIGLSDQAETIAGVARRYRPIVVWGGDPAGGYCTVATDNRQGGALAGAHLVACGCRSIAFFGDARAPEVRLRQEGCVEALAAAGAGPLAKVLPVHLTPDSAYRDITEWLDSGGAPDGIFAGSDVIAMNALRALADHGRDVPGTVRVVGFDDLPLAAQTSPPLTTVRQDLARGASALVDLLFRRIAGEDTPSLTMNAQLVVRDSTAVSANRRWSRSG